MGVAVSGWALANAVSRAGQMGVVSGTALAVVLARRLQMGDPGGDLRRALRQFPFPDMAKRVLEEFFIEGGKAVDTPFKPMVMPTLHPPRALVELTAVANFVEVYLAKEGHSGATGINYLEKMQLPTLPSIYGAMLAGVDYVLMGAGIPRAIPGVLDQLAEGTPVSLRIDVKGALPGEEYLNTFDPREFCDGEPPRLKRPQFIGIVSSATLAMTLAKKSNGQVNGFVVEAPSAGGHNAPPRGPQKLTDQGEPLYGPRDVPELEKITALGLPFWLAGSYGRPGGLAKALELGATGVQVGTAFAFCEESGLTPELKQHALTLSRNSEIRVFTDPLASPTGFPFKVAQMEGTLSETECYCSRERVCDLGYLRQLYRKEDGEVGYRCPAEPEENHLHRGGTLEETLGRKCICNALPASVGLGQTRSDGSAEPPIVTAGDELAGVSEFIEPGHESYTAAEVVARLLR